MHNMWFQRNGATPHTARETIAILRDAFPGKLISRSGDVSGKLISRSGDVSGKLISRSGDVSWPPQSPDSTSPEFFSGVPQIKGLH